MRTLSALASLGLVLTLGLTAVAASPVAATSQSTSAAQLEPVSKQAKKQNTAGKRKAKQVVKIVNKERAKYGLKPLKIKTCETGYARRWSKQMGKTLKFKHRPNLGDILRKCDADMVGENIAAGQTSAQAVMTAWMNSPGHRSNILEPRYNTIGVGAVKKNGRWWWTQNFTRR